MMPPLVSFSVAKKHLNLVDRNDMDGDVDVKLRLASFIVTNHCKLTSIPDEWVTDSLDVDSPELILIDDSQSSPPESYYAHVPGNIQAAILLVLSDLFENRESATTQVLSDPVINLLAPFRDPTMA